MEDPVIGLDSLGCKDLIEDIVQGEHRLVITSGGKKIAAIVPYEDLYALECIENHMDLNLIEG